jgi:hypothetical protein
MQTTMAAEIPPVQNQNEVVLSSVSETEAELRATLGLPPVDAPTPPDPVTPATPAPVAEEPKEKAPVELRINQLTRERYEEKARADQLEAELARIRAIPTPIDAAPGPAPTPVEAVPAVEVPPKPTEDDYPSFADYMEALTDWKLAQNTAATEQRVIARLQQERQQAAQQQWDAQQRAVQVQAEQDYLGRLAQAREAYPDYNEVLASATHLPVTAEVQLVIQNSPVGVDLGYHLMKHPAELDRITRLPPAAQFIEMGKLEALHERGLLTPSAPPATSRPGADVRPPAGVPAPRPVASRAPAPPPRVNPSAVTPSKDPEQMTYAEYAAWRAAGGGR